jgi:hypothetical protein
MPQQFDRSAEHLGNAIHLEHVNVQVPDRQRWRRSLGASDSEGVSRYEDDPSAVRPISPTSHWSRLDASITR